MIFSSLVAKAQTDSVFIRLIEKSLVRCLVILSKAKNLQIQLAEILRYAQYDMPHWNNYYIVTTITFLEKH